MSAIQSRTSFKFVSPGPYLAKVTNYNDITKMGGLEVIILKGMVPDPNYQSQTWPVRYLSPFYGVTDVRFEGNNRDNFDDVQKSYGFWMVPPDIGSIVMVIFVGGDPNQGYWIGCPLTEMFQNHMVPGISATENVLQSAEDKNRYGVSALPAAEFHKKSNKTGSVDPDRIEKPIHPFAEKLLKQGLLADPTRGTTTSTARRETPSAVFGISTPGRLNPNGKKALIGYESKQLLPISRVGGHTFVMDDGDKAGDNQLIRLRSAAGHQILFHDTKNLVYIANANGTAWVELTANGKIDIYAKDSVSIHTENDFNFKADRDINIEAGNNINIKAANSLNANIDKNLNILVLNNGVLKFNGTYDFSSTGTYKVSVGGEMHTLVSSSIYITSGNNTNIRSTGDHIETATNIHMNGPIAQLADPAQSLNPLALYELPKTNIAKGWENKIRYNDGVIYTIVPRVPMHEPWVAHETF
jgi:hypothetical protein